MTMSADELKTLEQEIRKLKRIATEWAGQMHDLAEERLPAGFEQIHAIAEATYNACRAWKEASDRLRVAQTEEATQP